MRVETYGLGRVLSLTLLVALVSCGVAHEGDSRPRESVNSLPSTGAAGQKPREASDSATLRAAYITAVQQQADEAYWLAPAGGSDVFTGENPAHALRLEVSAAGALVIRQAHERTADAPFRLRLRGSRLGRGAELRPLADAASVVPRGNRVSLQRPVGLEEWFVNGPLGLQQGFVLAERPAGHGELVLEVQTEGDLSPSLTEQQDIELRTETGAVALRYTDLFVQDAAGRVLNATMAVVDDAIQLRIDDADASYPLYVDPILWTEEQKLAPNGVALDGQFFGQDVDIDGNTAVVGGSASSSRPGAAYVFVRAGGVWTRQQMLMASDGHDGNSFGSAVALDGDTIVVGATQDDENGQWAGAAYVFVRSGSTWTEQQKLLPADGATFDGFGNSIGVQGDTALVGARYDDEPELNRGSAYVFVRSGSTWTEQQKLVASDGAEQDHFGEAVALDGDTALIGADFDDDQGDKSGSAYVFVYGGSTWNFQQKLLPTVGVAKATFGASVALDADTALIGAPGDIGSGLSGAAHVFVRSGSTWTEAQTVVSGDLAVGDRFGEAVSLEGGTAVIGAPGEDEGADSAGALYVFVDSGGTWTEQDKLVADGARFADVLGGAVALSGSTAIGGARQNDIKGTYAGAAFVFVDTGGAWSEEQRLFAGEACSGESFGGDVSVDGDTLVASARLHDDVAWNAGAAYVYVRSAGVWSRQEKLVASDAVEIDLLGSAVALVGDTAIVGATGVDDNGDASGAAYVFTRAATEWTEVQKLLASDGTADDDFGEALAVDADTLVIGAASDDAMGSYAGSAYVFARSAGPWTEEAKLVASDPAPSNYFGYSVAVDADTAVVGAYSDDDLGDAAGASYVFTRSAGVWTEQQQLYATDADDYDFFGRSVAVHGDTVLVGADGDDAAASGAGAAYVFLRSAAVWAEHQKLVASDATASDSLGDSVALAADRALVGATGVSGGGAVYGFVESGGTWTEHDRLVPLDPTTVSSGFGTAVALSGDTAVIGSPSDHPDGYTIGAAHVFIVTTLVDGSACGADIDCRSGYCVDSTCCDTACGNDNPTDCVECSTGVCTELADTSACSDDDACTQTDSCASGVCMGTNPVTCVASDQCHDVGTCDPLTGICSDPNLPDNTPCDDSDACSQTDTCQSGVCTGDNWIVCVASDQCHDVGTCDPVTAICSDPALPDGTSCDDSDGCTQTDTCQTGVCTGDNPVVCAASDQCHEVGTCDPLTGLCSDPALPDGTSCDDSDACTQTDACQSGVCTGADAVVCTATDECHAVGTCDTSTGQCDDPALPDGTPCSMGTCQAGVCVPDGTGGGGTGGTGGVGGTGDVGGTGGSAASTAGEQPEDDGGCGCRVPGRTPAPAPWSVVALLGAAVVSLRRRRIGYELPHR